MGSMRHLSAATFAAKIVVLKVALKLTTPVLFSHSKQIRTPYNR